MDLFLAVARFIHFAAAHQVFGLAAFSLMSPLGLRAATREPTRLLAVTCSLVLFLSAFGWLMATAGSMGDGPRDATNPDVIATVLNRTEFGAVWRIRLVVCALLLLGTTKNYMDRQVLGVLKTTLQHDLGWSEIDYSNLVFAFQTAYAAGMLLVGWVIDRLGTRLGYALAMVSWSLASMGHAVSTSLTPNVAEHAGSMQRWKAISALMRSL